MAANPLAARARSPLNHHLHVHAENRAPHNTHKTLKSIRRVKAAERQERGSGVEQNHTIIWMPGISKATQKIHGKNHIEEEVLTTM